MTKLGHISYSGIKKPQFMESSSAPFESVSPSSGQNDCYMYIQLPDKSKAASYYYNAASIGKDAEAMNCLALIYEQGLGLHLDKSNFHNPLLQSYLLPKNNSRTLRLSMKDQINQQIDLTHSLDQRIENNPHRGLITAAHLYNLALKKMTGENGDVLFNLGFLYYRMSASINFEDPDSNVNSKTEEAQRSKGISLMQEASDAGHLRAQQFLMQHNLLYHPPVDRSSLGLSGPQSQRVLI
jgi:TPR repeat protein